jgi:hypothetical protein
VFRGNLHRLGLDVFLYAAIGCHAHHGRGAEHGPIAFAVMLYGERLIEWLRARLAPRA